MKHLRFGLSCSLIGALLLGAATSAFAHHRDFVFLRDWYLPFKGENEMEYRVTHNNRGNAFMHEVEFEHGVTDHFAIEPGIEWHSEDGEKLHLDGMDIELRFNFGEAKMNQILPALNVEYEHPFDSEEPDHGELKFVLSYFTPKGEDFSINLNVGQELSKDRERESEIMFGYVRPLQKLETSKQHGYKIGLRGGFESQFSFEDHTILFGPTIAFEKDEHFNIIAHYFWALNHVHEASDGFRLIAEWEF